MKNRHIYAALRKKGYSVEAAAKIANSKPKAHDGCVKEQFFDHPTDPHRVIIATDWREILKMKDWEL